MADAIERERLAGLRAFFIVHQCRIRAQNGSACMPRVEQGGRERREMERIIRREGRWRGSGGGNQMKWRVEEM